MKLDKLLNYKFYGWNAVFARKIFCCLCSCALFSSLPPIFTCWSLAFHIFSPPLQKFNDVLAKKYMSPLFLSVALALSLLPTSAIGIMKFSWKKTRLSCLFVSKRPDGHAIYLQNARVLEWGISYRPCRSRRTEGRQPALVNDFAPNTFQSYNFSNYCLRRFINTVSDHLGNSNSRMSSRKRPNGETIEGGHWRELQKLSNNS